MKRVSLGILLALVWCLTHISSGHAHKVTIFAWTEGDTVHTESKFSGGKHVQGGKVEVFDTNSKLLLGGRTDDNGLFSFKVPNTGDLNIVLTAGMGHRNAWRLSGDDLGSRGVVPSPEDRGHPTGC